MPKRTVGYIVTSQDGHVLRWYEKEQRFFRGALGQRPDHPDFDIDRSGTTDPVFSTPKAAPSKRRGRPRKVKENEHAGGN